MCCHLQKKTGFGGHSEGVSVAFLHFQNETFVHLREQFLPSIFGFTRALTFLRGSTARPVPMRTETEEEADPAQMEALSSVLVSGALFLRLFWIVVDILRYRWMFFLNIFFGGSQGHSKRVRTEN